MKRALITGITGQDGAYLAEFPLGKGYEVHGIKRRASSFNTARVDNLYKDPHEKNVRFFMHYGDLTDATNLIRIIRKIEPEEIYNLAAQSHVMVSFETPEYTENSDALGTLRLLEAIRILNLEKKPVFTRHQLPKCLARSGKYHKMKTLLFTPDPLTVLQNFILTGLPLTTARLTIYMHAMVFYLITNHPFAAKHLLPEKLHGPWYE